MAPVTPPIAVADTPAKPAEIVATEAVVTPAAVVDTPQSAEDEAAALVTKVPLEEAAKSADEVPSTPKEKPDKEHTDTAKSSEAHAKSGAVAQSTDATFPAKVEELSVQVLQEGTGAVVKRGDMVTLEYTISYVPRPGADKKDDAKKKDAKSSKKSDAKKSDDKKSDEKKTDDAKPKDGDKPADEKKEPAPTEHKDEAVAQSDDKTAEKAAEKHADDKDVATKTADSKPSETKTADGDAKSSDTKIDEAKVVDAKPNEKKNGEAKTADAKSGDTKSAEAKPVDPLAPVIVASTKSFTTPFTVKLTENGKPKLMPGLVRGVEGLKVGTRARIVVPAALAYGKDGNKSAGIPPETPVEIEVFVKEARE